MNGIISYRTPQDYLHATEGFLMQKELENNLLIGLCYNIPDRTKEFPAGVFINHKKDDEIVSTSIKTWEKAIVGGMVEEREFIKPLAAYYQDHGVAIKGVVGENFYAEYFADCYGKGTGQTRTLIVHRLTEVNALPITSGALEQAEISDLDFLTDWGIQFEEDAGTFPKRTREDIMERTAARIRGGDTFKWVDKGEPVSIAMVVRRTQHVGFVGFVYTPVASRGKGYATSCVSKLSAHILQQGYKNCGLFTDKANPTSNRIYQRIGYVPTTEFTDIEFAGH